MTFIRRLDRLGRHRDARNQAASANRHDDDVDVVPVANDLETERALSGDELQVVERMHIGQAAVSDELLCFLVRVVPDRAVQNDLGAVAARGGDFRGRRILGHDDHGLDAVDAGGKRDSLCMIARRGADHTAAALILGKQHELVERTANLVGPGPLEHLRLEADVEARPFAQRPRGQQRRAVNVWRDMAVRRLERLHSEGHRGHRHLPGHLAVSMISTRPSAATSPVCTVARAGNSLPKNER